MNSFFDTFAGHKYDFYGVDSHAFCFGLDGSKIAFEAICDPSDGYRSYLESVLISTKNCIFSRKPIARVTLTKCVQASELSLSAMTMKTYFIGYEFIDRNAHVWLRMGTDYTDDYYPFFVFNYQISQKKHKFKK